MQTRFQKFLGALPSTTFIAESYQRNPIPGTPDPRFQIPHPTWELVEKALQPDSGADVLIAKDGTAWAGPNLKSAREAQALYDDGYTVVVRDCDYVDLELAQLGRMVAAELHGIPRVQVYFTRASHRGFGWHFDPEEVFLIQVAGRKRVALRENRQAPLPLLNRVPNHLNVENETGPIQEWELNTGAWLYIPAGYWHGTQAVDDTLSISLGLMPPTLLDALELVLAELQSLAQWRQRLPPLGHASPLSDDEKLQQCTELFGNLAQEVSQRLGSPQLLSKVMSATGFWTRRLLRSRRR